MQLLGSFGGGREGKNQKTIAAIGMPITILSNKGGEASALKRIQKDH